MSLEPVTFSQIADASAQTAPVRADRILVADDDEGICRFVEAVLKTAGYEIVRAENGDDALRICELDPSIKLILADVVMPHLGGRQLASHISGLHPHIKVMLMSGYPNLWGLLDGIASRTEKTKSECYFIQKPFSPAELTRKVREILSGKAAVVESASE